MNKKVEIEFKGWVAWTILFFAGVGMIHVTETVAKYLIAPYIYG